MNKNNKLKNKINKLNTEVTEKNGTIDLLINENKKKDNYLEKIHDDYQMILVKKDEDMNTLIDQHNVEIKRINNK